MWWLKWPFQADGWGPFIWFGVTRQWRGSSVSVCARVGVLVCVLVWAHACACMLACAHGWSVSSRVWVWKLFFKTGLGLGSCFVLSFFLFFLFHTTSRHINTHPISSLCNTSHHLHITLQHHIWRHITSQGYRESLEGRDTRCRVVLIPDYTLFREKNSPFARIQLRFFHFFKLKRV